MLSQPVAVDQMAKVLLELVPRQATFAPERPTRVSGGPAEGPPSAEVAEGTFVSSPEGAS
jgi:hypothetical protein